MRFPALVLLAGGLAAGPLAAAEVDFVHQIVPILREHCSDCHTGDKKKGGFSLNDRAALLKGGENGPAAVPGDSAHSKLLERVLSTDPDLRMPPKGARVPAEKVALLKAWIDAGLPWETGFAFKQPAYEPPLKPRRPTLPPVVGGRTNGIDRFIDAYFAKHPGASPRPAPLDDAAFVRRASLDLIGLLPSPATLDRVLADPAPDKRARFVQSLLTNDIQYAEHWLTFWNDLLRNDYAGTGYIDGGRKQISAWLYRALVDNKPYDQFVRELIAPTEASEGFARGIKWRGNVSAGQTVPVQFSQSVGQAFLGINLKCASCHDSFIDRWKLEEAYGLAAIYAEQPLELHRCDVPLGRKAKASWLFPELGQVDAQAPRPERLKQLAALMTHPDNGRFARTIVNRLWHRLMGRGLVHPVDAMQSEPWDNDLLDFLAVDLADHGYNLKHTLALIATSAAYQSRAQVVNRATEEHGYVYAGPRARRLTAEQFVDALWQLGGTAPARFDAPVTRGKVNPATVKTMRPRGRWIWAYPEANGSKPKAGETFVTRKLLVLTAPAVEGGAVISADNSFTLYVNGRKAAASDNWEAPTTAPFPQRLHAGTNELLIVAKNGGAGPNPAGLLVEGRLRQADGKVIEFASDATWEFTTAVPDAQGRFATPPTNWQAAALVNQPEGWTARIEGGVKSGMAQLLIGDLPPVRASLLKSDMLMRTLGRPNREQIVSMRPNDLTTLEAIDLANGPILADALEQAAGRIAGRTWASSDDLIQWLYRYALSRPPRDAELALARSVVGTKPSPEGVRDVLWAVVMLPEFQLVR